MARPLQTHCKRGHEFSEENTRIRPDGRRQCRVCDRLSASRNNGSPEWHLLPDGPPSYWNARSVRGPALTKWLRANLPPGRLAEDANLQRRLYAWSRDGRADFYVVDEVMIRYGFHPAVLPPEVWSLECIRGTEKEPKPKRPKPKPKKVIPKPCANCGETIPLVWASGAKKTPKRYAELKFCGEKCSGAGRRGEFKFGKKAA